MCLGQANGPRHILCHLLGRREMVVVLLFDCLAGDSVLY